MKIYETRTPEPKPYRALVKRTCDLCRKESRGGETEWDCATYEINETEITIKIAQKDGASYPEGGSGTKYDIDICPDCFNNKLIPWLISQGANIKQEDWDW